MAMRLELGPGQRPFEALLTGLSDPIQDGDIQMTGDGIPAILVREHQPTGGYPRIASVIRADLTVVAQLPTGVPFQFELVDHERAVQALQQWQSDIDGLVDQIEPVVRSVEQIDNLLSYNLIGGVVSAQEDAK
jgi:allophanate hydrolase